MKRADLFRYLFYFSFILLTWLVIYQRVQVLRAFSYQFPDSDQAIMWNAAKDFSHGIFHEPRFYGQAYNSMLEALIAVPLIKASVPYNEALPIATSIIALFPFFLLGLICLYKDLRFQALLAIAMPLLLPAEFDFISGMPRGFVTGIFIASIGWTALLFERKNRTFLCFTFFSIVGYSLNANSLLLSVPLSLYVFLEHLKNRQLYIFGGIGAVLGMSIDYCMNHFYVVHPNYMFRTNPSFELSRERFMNSLQDMDKHFNYISPIFWQMGAAWMLLIFLFFAGVFWKKKRSLAFAVVLLILMILVSLGVSKVHDATSSVYYSYARMFLPLPFAIVLFFSFLNIPRPNLSPLLVIPAAYFFFVKLFSIDRSIERVMNVNFHRVVTADPWPMICWHFQYLNYFCKKYDIDLVVIANSGYYDFYSYGCPVYFDNFPKTLRPEQERRTWRLEEDRDAVYSNILLIDENQQFATRLPYVSPYVKRFLNVNGYYILTGNSLKTMELLNKMTIPVRSF